MKKFFFVTAIIIFIFTGICSLTFAEEAQKPAAEKAPAELTWKDNSKAMFDKVVDMSPPFIKPMSEKKMRESLEKKAGASRIVTEDMVIETTKEETPSFVLEKTLKELEPLRTKK